MNVTAWPDSSCDAMRLDQPVDFYIYDVGYSDNAGSLQVVITSVAGQPPVIVVEPGNATNVIGTTANFTVAATGMPAPTYQWQKNATNISGATSATYTISATTTASAGSYTVVVTNSAGSKTSNVATLTVKRVDDTREYGVVLHDDAGRITGFQEKPDPEDAQSDLGNCGIYLFSPEIFDYFPKSDPVDWAHDVFPALLEADAGFWMKQLAELPPPLQLPLLTLSGPVVGRALFTTLVVQVPNCCQYAVFP